MKNISNYFDVAYSKTHTINGDLVKGTTKIYDTIICGEDDFPSSLAALYDIIFPDWKMYIKVWISGWNKKMIDRLEEKHLIRKRGHYAMLGADNKKQMQDHLLKLEGALQLLDMPLWRKLLNKFKDSVAELK